MRSILGIFFALSFDVKAGLLNKEDLIKRDHSLFFVSKDNEDTRPITQTRRRYAEVDITSNMISNDTLINILMDGYVDRDAIKKELNTSSFFVKVKDEPAWRTVWSGYERLEEDFNRALKVFEEQFCSRHFVLLGEIHHAFGLKLWLSRIGAIGQSIEAVVDECIKYIDDLYSSERLPTDQGFNPALVGGYNGLGVYEAETPEFAKLTDLLKEHILRARKDKYPTVAQSMLELMSEQPDKLFGAIAYVNGGENEFYRVPFWPAVPAASFVSRLIALSGIDQKTIFVALQGRYDGGFLERELASEKPWLHEVRTGLLEAAERMSPIARARVKSYVNFSIDKVLNIQEDPASKKTSAIE